MPSTRAWKVDFMVLNHDEDLMAPHACEQLLGTGTQQVAWKDVTVKAALLEPFEVRDDEPAGAKTDLSSLLSVPAPISAG